MTENSISRKVKNPQNELSADDRNLLLLIKSSDLEIGAEEQTYQDHIIVVNHYLIFYI